tara:strand:+ start:89 stop:1255 length:1167 start_codon:yes stop_codon:yes gene_type:complete
MKNISILGSTGSIGRSSLSVISLHPDKYKIFGLSGFSNIDLLIEQTLEFTPKYIVTSDLLSKKNIEEKLKQNNIDTEVLFGNDGYNFIASHENVTTVIAAITGSAGLLSTIYAAKNGKEILLANKESMVMAGELLNKICSESGAKLIPVDSEHNAIFQVISSQLVDQEVNKITLTASGGPFRDFDSKSLQKVTVEQALKHPNWKMGKKITIDSSTLMNKGLEVIEASYLFKINSEKIEVLIHPQSIIHSFVEFIDGSSLCQLGQPDMRIPIAYALGHPKRIASGVEGIELEKLSDLQFLKPNIEKFKCLKLAYECLSEGTAHCIFLNASNEIAVDSFLSKKIKFMQIPELIEKTLFKANKTEVNSLDNILEIDAIARKEANNILKKII